MSVFLREAGEYGGSKASLVTALRKSGGDAENLRELSFVEVIAEFRCIYTSGDKSN